MGSILKAAKLVSPESGGGAALERMRERAVGRREVEGRERPGMPGLVMVVVVVVVAALGVEGGSSAEGDVAVASTAGVWTGVGLTLKAFAKARSGFMAGVGTGLGTTKGSPLVDLESERRGEEGREELGDSMTSTLLRTE